MQLVGDPTVIISFDVGRIEFDGLIEVSNGLRVILQVGVGDPQAVVSFGVEGVYLDGPGEVGEGLAVIHTLDVGNPQMVVSFDVSGVEADGSGEIGDGLVVIPKIAVDRSPQAVGFGIARFEVNNPAKVGDGLDGVSQGEVCLPSVAVHFINVLDFQFDGSGEVVHGLLVLVNLLALVKMGVHQPAIVEGLGVVGLQLNDLGKVLDGWLALVLAGPSHPAQVVSISLLRIGGDALVEIGDALLTFTKPPELLFWHIIPQAGRFLQILNGRLSAPSGLPLLPDGLVGRPSLVIEIGDIRV